MMLLRSQSSLFRISTLNVLSGLRVARTATM